MLNHTQLKYTLSNTHFFLGIIPIPNTLYTFLGIIPISNTHHPIQIFFGYHTHTQYLIHLFLGIIPISNKHYPIHIFFGYHTHTQYFFPLFWVSYPYPIPNTPFFEYHTHFPIHIIQYTFYLGIIPISNAQKMRVLVFCKSIGWVWYPKKLCIVY